jgi:hypothetical protein
MKEETKLEKEPPIRETIRQGGFVDALQGHSKHKLIVQVNPTLVRESTFYSKAIKGHLKRILTEKANVCEVPEPMNLAASRSRSIVKL